MVSHGGIDLQLLMANDIEWFFILFFFVLKNLKRNFDHLLWKDAGTHVLSPVFRANKDFEDLQKGD